MIRLVLLSTISWMNLLHKLCKCLKQHRVSTVMEMLGYKDQLLTVWWLS
uniref:Uncharacterized protein n=1 Tax=Arundo donax TaxID=35708 RepID=A0A0A8Y5K6_ARUDO